MGELLKIMIKKIIVTKTLMQAKNLCKAPLNSMVIAKIDSFFIKIA